MKQYIKEIQNLRILIASIMVAFSDFFDLRETILNETQIDPDESKILSNDIRRIKVFKEMAYRVIERFATDQEIASQYSFLLSYVQDRLKKVNSYLEMLGQHTNDVSTTDSRVKLLISMKQELSILVQETARGVLAYKS